MAYARFEKPVIDANNALLTGVWCEVRREGVANNPLEPVFSDRMGDTPLSNPFFTAGSIVAFHAAGGAFQVRLYKEGYDETFRYVPVGLGAENDLQGFVPMGAWDNLTTYAIGDVVTHPDGGDLYLFASKVNDNLAQTPNAVGPADTAYWAYIGVAVQGPTGPSGVIGTWRGPWVTLTAYALHDAVQYAGSSYICVSSHTAGTFATDLAASKWQLTTAKGDHGDVESIVEGTGIDVDATDPAHPIVSINDDRVTYGLRKDTEDQVLSGGARVTVKNLGNLSGASITPDPGDRPIQKVTNNGAGSILPGSNEGAYTLQIINASGAGAITTTGWTLRGDAFDTTSTSKFLCSCIVTSDMKVMTTIKVA